MTTTAPTRPPVADDPGLVLVEQAVVGALIERPALRLLEVPWLYSTDFLRPAHGALLDAVDAVAGTPDADSLTVLLELRRRGLERASGGAPYMHTCMQACPSPVNVHHYAQAVVDASCRRVLEATAVRLSQMAAASEVPVSEAIERCIADLGAVWQRVEGRDRRVAVGAREGAA